MPARKHPRGGGPAMWGRAERQASTGAHSLFAQLSAPAVPSARAGAGIAALERLAARLRAGEWSEPLAALLEQAILLDGTRPPIGHPPASPTSGPPPA